MSTETKDRVDLGKVMVNAAPSIEKARHKCSAYYDEEHCFAPGFLRVVTLKSPPQFVTDEHSRCPDDVMFRTAKRCACGALAIGPQVAA